MASTTRAFRLSRWELATSAVAAVVSSTAYVTQGSDYLARGVVGDLAGFGVLALVAAVVGARLRHEALMCLGGIGLLAAASPDWPTRLPQACWWTAFVVGLVLYVTLRQRVCD